MTKQKRAHLRWKPSARALGRKNPARASLPQYLTQPRERPFKATMLVDLLKRPEGTTLEQMMGATGWQKHSVRGFLAGALRNRYGLTASRRRALWHERRNSGGTHQ